MLQVLQYFCPICLFNSARLLQPDGNLTLSAAEHSSWTEQLKQGQNISVSTNCSVVQAELFGFLFFCFCFEKCCTPNNFPTDLFQQIHSNAMQLPVACHPRHHFQQEINCGTTSNTLRRKHTLSELLRRQLNLTAVKQNCKDRILPLSSTRSVLCLSLPCTLWGKVAECWTSQTLQYKHHERPLGKEKYIFRPEWRAARNFRKSRFLSVCTQWWWKFSNSFSAT